MGKDQELLQAVKTEDLLTVQKLLQRPRPGKASKTLCSAAKCTSQLVFQLKTWLLVVLIYMKFKSHIKIFFNTKSTE